jgi:tripartite-type tricarboxylate transporter receptor subunit TctC
MSRARFFNRRFLLASIGACLAASYSQAFAQLSGRTVTIIVPYTPGTGVDTIARVIASELQKRWGQTVIVDNRPGASGIPGMQAVARAEPDGHTLLMAAPSFTMNASLLPNANYDPVGDFTPIIECARDSMALAVHPARPAASVREFLQYVKSRSDAANYGSPGSGTPQHLAMELLKIAAKIEIQHVPHKGMAGAVTSLVGGHVDAMFIPLNVALPLAKDGKIKLLAVSSVSRAALAPDVPTFAEEGLSDVAVGIWIGLFAPAKTGHEIVAKYNATINEMLRSLVVAAQLAKQGFTTVGGTPDAFADFIAGDVSRWRTVTQKAGIVLN